MINKILIFFPHDININAGGPVGFLAHTLQDKPKDFFEISCELDAKKNIFQKSTFKIARFWNSLTHKRAFHKAYFKAQEHFKKIHAQQYKYIYFHNDIDFFYVKDLILDEQCVIFQPHSPELHSEEFKAYDSDDIQMYNHIQQAEKSVFERADIIVLPNPECKPIYQSLYTSRNKFYYILSGAKSNYHTKNQERYELDTNMINLMYIGRRNIVKGFDIVLESFKKARIHRKDIQLFVIGSGDKINEDGIIDVGFSDNPIAWYNSADYLINANRQSYFDLSIIEAISTGIPIIMSDNLGHQYYRGKSKLITTYDINQNDALYHIFMSNLKKRVTGQQDNIRLYQSELTDNHYFERFRKFFDGLSNL